MFPQGYQFNPYQFVQNCSGNAAFTGCNTGYNAGWMPSRQVCAPYTMMPPTCSAPFSAMFSSQCFDPYINPNSNQASINQYLFGLQGNLNAQYARLFAPTPAPASTMPCYPSQQSVPGGITPQMLNQMLCPIIDAMGKMMQMSVLMLLQAQKLQQTPVPTTPQTTPSASATTPQHTETTPQQQKQPAAEDEDSGKPRRSDMLAPDFINWLVEADHFKKADTTGGKDGLLNEDELKQAIEAFNNEKRDGKAWVVYSERLKNYLAGLRKESDEDNVSIEDVKKYQQNMSRDPRAEKYLADHWPTNSSTLTKEQYLEWMEKAQDEIQKTDPDFSFSKDTGTFNLDVEDPSFIQAYQAAANFRADSEDGKLQKEDVAAYLKGFLEVDQAYTREAIEQAEKKSSEPSTGGIWNVFKNYLGLNN